MTILRSLLSLISLILIMNLISGYLVYRQFSSIEQSLDRDRFLGELLKNETRMQLLASNYLNTQSQQHYSQYRQLLEDIQAQIITAEQFFKNSPSIEKIHLIKTKLHQARIILKKYQFNQQQYQLFLQKKQIDKLNMATELESQLRSQLLIVYQEIVVQTLRLRSFEQQKKFDRAQNDMVKMFSLLVLIFLIVSFFSYLIYRRISSRITYISEAAKRLGEGDLKVRIKSDDNDDMSYLIRTFNYMASRLELAEQENQKMLNAAERQAYHDALTGLPNRRYMIEKLDNELSRATRHKFKGALIFIDLDNFKGLNDSMGHPAGDKLLMDVSRRMISQIRSEDTLARMGGDEFVLLLPELERSAVQTAFKAEQIAEKIRASIIIPYDLSGTEFTVTASLGICIFPDDGTTSEELLRHSDIAMYQSKKHGRNCITFYSSEMQDNINVREKMKVLLSRAINNNQLETWYQVKVDRVGNIVGAEVLARWQDADQGWISPERFIPIAEQNALIIPLGKWLIKHVTKTVIRWNTLGLCQQLKHLSINISPEQFYDSELIDLLIAMGKSFDQYSMQLVVEITEGVLLSNTFEVIQSMALLKKNNIIVSIDDFGTGYSSMAYLKRLEPREIKIDRSFIFNIHNDKDNQVIVETIFSIAEHFKMQVVAEGVETEAELNFLKQKNCHLFQGYYFSKPLPEDDFLVFLEKGCSRV